MTKYSSLSRAQLDFEYLHTNSTTHEFLFGAFAELLDNSRDAAATKVSIFTVQREDLRGGSMLCFLDNGEGMDPTEIASVMRFGTSNKKVAESNMIGQYGNGLKSGSMRIGKDFILFSKKDSHMSCLMLSRTFHETENLREVIVPMPSWSRQTRLPAAQDDEERAKHDIELELILKYSPFNTKKQIFDQFEKIESENGTLVVIFNLKTLDNGEPEIDIKSDPKDILLNQMDYELEYENEREHFEIPEKKSFRAYTAVLYQEPRMRIFVQHDKVRTKRLETLCYLPKQYEYSSARFKARSEKETHEAENRCKIAEERAREAESDARNLETRLGDGGSKEERMELRRAQQNAIECRRDCDVLKKMALRKRKSLKEPKTLKFTFGLNIQNRKCFGMFVYNCSRLIKMYERVGPQLEGGSSGVGIIGIVNVPYLVLEPTHNKQDFADAKEYKHLLRALGEHLHHYWQICGVVDPRTGSGVRNFWAEFGYFTNKWTEEPSSELKYVKKRNMKIQPWMQCDRCLTWRQIPFSMKDPQPAQYDNSEEWNCSMNPDIQFNKCTISEQQLKIGLANINHKPFEEKTTKKSAAAAGEVTRERKSTGERRNSSVSEEPIAKKQLVSKSIAPPSIFSKADQFYKEQNARLKEKAKNKELERKRKQAEKEKQQQQQERLEKQQERLEKQQRLQRAEAEKRARERKKRKTATSSEEEESEEEAATVKNGHSSSSRRAYSPPSFPHKKMKADQKILTSSNHIEREPSREVVNLKKIQNKLAESLRLSLHYFSPPSWPTKKEDLINLDLDKLLEFPLNNFFDTYEVNLTELIGQYQEHASTAEKRAETAEEKLHNVRKLVMQLLKPSLNFTQENAEENEEIGDNVDEILAAVVKETNKIPDS